jgi:hypothetical protein
MTAMHRIAFIGVYGKAAIADAMKESTNKNGRPQAAV